MPYGPGTLLWTVWNAYAADLDQNNIARMEQLGLPYLVAVHVGAGMHAQNKFQLYKDAIRNACKSAAAPLMSSDQSRMSCGGALRAVCSAIKVLEVGGQSPVMHFCRSKKDRTGSLSDTSFLITTHGMVLISRCSLMDSLIAPAYLRMHQ